MRTLNPQRRLLLCLSLAALGILGLGGRFFLAPKEGAAFITAPAVRMDIEQTVVASGTLNALKTVEVGAQVSGQLKTLKVALGDRVKKGQLLAEIDPVLQRNALRDTQASLEDVQAQKLSKEAYLRQYEAAFQRQVKLAAQDASMQADLEAARAQMEGTRADIAALAAQTKKARIAVDTARANLEYTRINAPMDGMVISITTQEGQTVVSAQAVPTILTLANLETITVKAQISEADVDRVKPGQSVYFTTLGDSDTRHYGRLRAIEPGAATTASTTSTAVYYNGLFEIDNRDHRLRTAMTAQVSIVLKEAKRALCVPASALGDREGDGKCTIRVLRKGLPEARRIRVGINNNIQAEVLDGLKDGERVLIGDGSVPPVQNTGPMGPPPPRRG